MNIFEVKNLYKSYGSLGILKGINFNIQAGEIVSIVGASGAGKSTVLHILGSLDKPDSGEVIFEGKNIFNQNDSFLSEYRNKKLGFIFQFHHLLPEFTALENVCIPAFIAQKNRRETELKAKKLLEKLGLGHRLDHKPNELSGGEQQRAAVARAMINDPAIILADEPSGNLDSKNAAELHQLFFDIRDEFKQSILIVTHNDELAKSSDRILHIKDGVFIS